VHARARCHGPNLFGSYKVDLILSSDGIGRVFAAARAPTALLVVGGTVDPPTLLSPTSAQAIALMCQQGVVGGASSLSVPCPRSPCACTCTCTRTRTCILTCPSLHPYPSPLPPQSQSQSQSQSHYQSTPRITQQHRHPAHLHCVVTLPSRRPTIRHQSKAQTGCQRRKTPAHGKENMSWH
jgi:hypothetical protein